jgi:LemA protein
MDMTLAQLAGGAGAIAGIVIGIVLLLMIFYAVGVYNQLVTLQQRFKNAYAQIDVQLQRRYDLIPNLVETVKGYMAHERGTLEAVIQARNQAMAASRAAAARPGEAGAMEGLMAAETALSGTLGRLFALAEAYPDLKANTNMIQLSEELTSTENKISFARQAYNDSATSYNVYKKKFPPVFFAAMFGHGEDARLLEFDTAKIKEAPKVAF